MIEGLKVTVAGSELRGLCVARAAHHRERAKVYAEQIGNLTAANVEGMQYSNGDPKKALADRMGQHESEAAELEFVGAHLDAGEFYLLDRDDLRRLGIVPQHRY